MQNHHFFVLLLSFGSILNQYLTFQIFGFVLSLHLCGLVSNFLVTYYNFQPFFMYLI
nr:MAG TPA: hypothetical protein [Caudoviricetes sp.]